MHTSWPGGGPGGGKDGVDDLWAQEDGDAFRAAFRGLRQAEMALDGPVCLLQARGLCALRRNLVIQPARAHQIAFAQRGTGRREG